MRFAVRCEWDRTLVHVLGAVDRTISSENHRVFFRKKGTRERRPDGGGWWWWCFAVGTAGDPVVLGGESVAFLSRGD